MDRTSVVERARRVMKPEDRYVCEFWQGHRIVLESNGVGRAGGPEGELIDAVQAIVGVYSSHYPSRETYIIVSKLEEARTWLKNQAP